MPNYSYVRLYANENGESHFEDVSGEMIPTDFAPPAPITFTGGHRPVKTALFFSALRIGMGIGTQPLHRSLWRS
jgi:hypothetical protein